MKQVILVLAVVIFFCNCNPAAVTIKNEAEETKLKLLKQAGFNKMEKGFTYDYTVQNDSVVAVLTLVPTSGVISFDDADSSKGMLLNVFIAANGQQYNTSLKRTTGGFYQVGIRTIDGVEIPVFVYVEPDLGGCGIPPGGDNGNPQCKELCDNFYKYSFIPGLQKKADSLCKAVEYDYKCPERSNDPCFHATGVIFPSIRSCGNVSSYLGTIAMSRFGNGIVITNPSSPKTQ